MTQGEARILPEDYSRALADIREARIFAHDIGFTPGSYGRKVYRHRYAIENALDICTRTPAIADGVGVEEENRALRGTLEYILRQAQLNHPGALTVIRMNAKAALDREWQKTVKQAMRDIITTPPQAATDEG